MKKLYISILGVLVSGLLSAQVDRSKMPEPGPAPEIELGKTESFTLDNGLKVFVVENHKLPRVAYSIQLDFDPIVEGDKAGTADIAGDLLSRGTTNRSKDELNFAIDFIGARFGTSASSVFASSLKKHQNKLLELMADVVKNANFQEEELEKLKTQYISGIQANKDDPDAISDNVARVLLYGKDHPYGEITTEESVKNITLEDAKNFYTTYFRPNIAYMAVVGDITVKEVKPLIEKYFGDWKSGEVPSYTYEMPKQPENMQVVFVNKPGAVQSVVTALNTIELKPGSENAVKAGIANGILGGGFVSKLNLNLREAHSYTYGARSSIDSDELVGSFDASAKVRNEVTDSTIIEMMKEIMSMRNGGATEDELETVKNFRTGTFALGLENPQTIAQYAINIERYNMPKDYYANYLKNVAAVSLEDVNTMSKKYFNPLKGYILVVGNQEEVADKVKALSPTGQLIFMDALGNEVEETSLKPAPEGVTAESVLKKYIDAIGGEKALSKVKSLKTEMTTSMQGMSINITVINEGSKNYSSLVSMNGMTIEKQVLNGDKGKVSGMQGSKEMDADALAKAKQEAQLFPELSYLSGGDYKLELKGVDTKNDEEVYALAITDPTGSVKTNYYSVKSGLLVAAEETNEGILITQTLSDYKAVKKVMFPYTIVQNVGPQKMDLKVEEVVVNGKIDSDTFNLD
jgi:predicted Zn-dependent peptidase